MAMINNIRKRKNLLLVIIVIAMLLFLVPYDAIMSWAGGGATTAGEINGTSISQDDYRNALAARKNLGLNYQGDGALSNSVWSDMIETRLLSDDYDEMGIYVTDEEFEDITFGDNISAFVKGTFYGQNPINDEARENLRNFFETMSKSKYDGFKKLIISKRKKEKWDALMSKGFYANPVDAKMDYRSKNDKVTFDYVVKKYSDIDDSEISYDDSDLSAYYNAHKNELKFQQTKTRDIDFVEFVISPSSIDSSEVRKEVNVVASQWKNSDNDSLFYVLNVRGKGFYQPKPYADKQFSGWVNDSIQKASKGTVFGPFLDKGTYKVAKVVDVTFTPDSVDARHILIKGTGDLTVQQAKLDSIQNLIQSGAASFEDMVAQFSEDPGSQAKGGLYENISPGQMVPTFNDFVFNNKVGDMGIVTTSYGLHLIEIMKQNAPTKNAMVVSIDRPIKPSSITMKEGYKKADKFVSLARTPELFDELADSLYTKKEQKGITRNTNRIGTISNPTSIVNWVMRASEGDISQAKQVGDRYIVAHLKAVKKKGVAPLKYVKEIITEEVIKLKKFELYKDIMNGNSLEDVATAVEGKKQTARNITKASGVVSTSGISDKEPKVIGLAFAIPSGEMSIPIQGEAGIWVLAPVEVTAAPEKDEYVTDQDNVQKVIKRNGTRIYGSMIKKAKVNDGRYDN